RRHTRFSSDWSADVCSSDLLVTARGLAATTDQHGRFHITCAITPREGRGSNFVLKLDDRTLPTGYRGSTDATQVRRATRGKALRSEERRVGKRRSSAGAPWR